MRLFAWMSLARAALLALAGFALGPGTSVAVEQPAANGQPMVVARAGRAGSVPWASFQPVSFAGRAVVDGHPWWTKLAPPAGDLRYVALHFSGVTATAGKPFSLELRDDGGRLLASYDAGFLAANPNFMTAPLKPGRVSVLVRGAVASGDLAFTVDQFRLAQHDDRWSPQSIQPHLKLYDAMTPTFQKAARGVVLLTINETDVCTGFLLNGGVIATAFHCLATSASYNTYAGAGPRPCADITIAFDYNGATIPPLSNPHCKSVVASSADKPIDIALLTLDGPAPGAAGRELSLAAADPIKGQSLQILEHPWGQAIGLAWGCGVASDPASPKFEHNCDTIGGASGGPVLNDQGQVVGLHTDGYIDDSATSIAVIKAYYAACQAGHCPPNLGTLVSSLKTVLN